MARHPIESATHKTERARLDERTCRLICPISAAMVGVCLTAVGILRVVIAVGRVNTVADDLIAFDAVVFLVATLSSYFALRINGAERLHRVEQIADFSFISAMVLMIVVIFIITYAVTR